VGGIYSMYGTDEMHTKFCSEDLKGSPCHHGIMTCPWVMDGGDGLQIWSGVVLQLGGWSRG
jgi:hypothetical protein